MNAIESVFKRNSNNQNRVLIPYITAGFPSVNFTVAAIERIAEAGADFLEIGMPFSDPIADGPLIQYASHQALLKGMRVKHLFFIAERTVGHVSIPLVIMTYYNPVYQYGVKSFVRDIKNAGFHGVIVPDLPIEEGLDFASLCIEEGIAPIQMVTPLTSEDRINIIAQFTRGFLYCVSMPGVTGQKIGNIDDIVLYLKKVKHIAKISIAVGFGVSCKKDAEILWEHADGVIVGSALINLIRDVYVNTMYESSYNTILTRLYDFVLAFKS